MSSKSILAPFLTAASSLCLMAQPLLAATFGKFSYTYNGTSITITDYPNDAVGAVVIPATINEKPVTAIGYEAFNWCTGLTSVCIPNSVTSIGEAAFYRCTSLTSVSIPNRVKSIGKWAFQACDKLTRVSIGSSVTSIGESAFAQCTRLVSVSIPNRVKSIRVGAFKGCSGLTNVSIPNSVTAIGYEAFSFCSGLTSVAIPDSVTSIGDLAFFSCTGLTRVIFLGNAPSMGTDVFSDSASGFAVYFLQGKTGFTAPMWNGYPCKAIEPAPEIAVEQPAGTNLRDGISKKSFGTVVVGHRGTTKTFTIRNTGTENLTGLAITKTGAMWNFSVSALPETVLAPGASTTFKVTFKPTKTGTLNATIHISSNDTNENPFDIKLTGLGVVP